MASIKLGEWRVDSIGYRFSYTLFSKRWCIQIENYKLFRHHYIAWMQFVQLVPLPTIVSNRIESNWTTSEEFTTTVAYVGLKMARALN